MAFPSIPDRATNKWIDRCIEPFRKWCESRQVVPNLKQFIVREDPHGVYLDLHPTVAAAVAAAAVVEPFDCSDGGLYPVGAATGRKVLVRQGSVNDLIEGVGLTVTGDITAPTGYWAFAVSGSTDTYLMEKATIETSGAVSAAEIYLDATPDITDVGDSGTGEPPDFAYRKLAKISVYGGPSYAMDIIQYTRKAQQAVVTVSDWACSTIQKIVLWLP